MKRRKRERKIVARELIRFHYIPGASSTANDWEFFYRCYENTYFEHHSRHYLNEVFFKLSAQRTLDNLHLITLSNRWRAVCYLPLFNQSTLLPPPLCKSSAALCRSRTSRDWRVCQ
ncbi:peptidogalycan biosysnthesis protein [Polynucleobacter necessarius]|uniref:peptidogalycan biosysnthesis protein n=1 Tax=Polynucleobacter necessarius TaxID=576610 RepID=UPI000E09B648